MFRIGDFSRLSQVSVKMLRHYDDLGLLKPARVDHFTGYRYYAIDQLPRLNRLLALKDLGFSLEQIGGLLDDELPAPQIRGMLTLKRAELQGRVREEQARLSRVEARLRQLEQEGTMPEHEIVVKRVAPQLIASACTVAPTLDDMDRFCREVGDAVDRSGIRKAGPWMNIYHHEGFRERDLDVEAAVPVEGRAEIAQPTDGPVTVRELPGVETMASLSFAFSPEALLPAYQAIGAWIHANGYTIAGPCREVYVGEIATPASSMMEIQFPVARE